jgi:hypothetical protein
MAAEPVAGVVEVVGASEFDWQPTTTMVRAAQTGRSIFMTGPFIPLIRKIRYLRVRTLKISGE